MNLRTDYSDVHFKENGKLKLLSIVGTRPEIIRGVHIIYTGRKRPQHPSRTLPI